jgi:type I restriction enzyme R subunit
LDKKTLSERDICTKYITPALQKAGWNIETQILEEVSFTDGKIFVRGKLTARGKRKRADYILYYNSNRLQSLKQRIILIRSTLVFSRH